MLMSEWSMSRLVNLRSDDDGSDDDWSGDSLDVRDGVLAFKPKPWAPVRWAMRGGEWVLPWLGLGKLAAAWRGRRLDWVWPYMRTGEVWWRPVGDGTVAEFRAGPGQQPWARRSLRGEGMWVFDVHDYLDHVRGRPQWRLHQAVMNVLLGRV